VAERDRAEGIALLAIRGGLTQLQLKAETNCVGIDFSRLGFNQVTIGPFRMCQEKCRDILVITRFIL
jgi:hypothetical protein